jgi:hypothetical protein
MTSSTHPRDWFAMPIVPLNNLYSSLLLPLVFAKLRTATILVDHVYRSFHNHMTINDLFEHVRTLFRQTLKLNRLCVEQYVNIDYECLLHLSRIDRLHTRKMLTMNSLESLKNVVEQLLNAIRLCYLSVNDGQFIQTCYFELALVFIEYTRLSTNTIRKSSTKTDTSELLPADRSSNVKQRQTGASVNVQLSNEMARKQQQLKQAAAVAIRAATQMALNQKQRYTTHRVCSLVEHCVCT